MFVPHLEDCIFIHIPKTGGTSIANSLHYVNQDNFIPIVMGSIPKRSHQVAEERIKEYSIEDWNRLFKFTIIRNPWDHIVSCYHWYRIRDSFEDWILSGYQCNTITDQWRYFTIDNQIVVDYVGRFETLRETMRYIHTKLNRRHDSILPHDYQSEPRPHYKEYFYKQQLIDIIADNNLRLISEFNYSY